MMDGMKGLFRVEFYDYFDEDIHLICISQDKEKLKQRAYLDNPESQVFSSCDEIESDPTERHVAYYIIDDVEMIQ